MLNRYKVFTLTHKRINLKEIGEYVVKAPDALALQQRLAGLKEQFGLEELLYLSTCNRVLYFFDAQRPLDLVFAIEFFRQVNPDLSDEALTSLEHTLIMAEGNAALEHLFTVAASMDSMVIGERQIIGQLREAYEQCRSWNLIGDRLRLAVDQAILTAKAIYSQTRIGDKPVSVASLALQKLLRQHPAKDARILIVGAGQTNAIVAKLLAKHHFTNVTVFNRTLAKAEAMAASFDQGQAHSLAQLSTYTGGFDVLVVCTAAHEPIITPEVYTHLLQGDTASKTVIDLAIPHNVAPAVVQEFAPHYIEVEGLRLLAKENLAFREKEMHHAQVILEKQLAEFPGILQQRRLEIALRAVPEEIRAVKTKAIEEVFQKELAEIDPHFRDLVERMLNYMEKKCIGIPMKAAKSIVLE